jgi:hypothetical protein
MWTRAGAGVPAVAVVEDLQTEKAQLRLRRRVAAAQQLNRSRRPYRSLPLDRPIDARP